MVSSKSNATRARGHERRALTAASLALAGAVALNAPSAEAIPCSSPCVPSGTDKVVLALYWSTARLDNMTVANANSRQAALDAGYVFARNEALLFREYKPGLIPLRLYYHVDRTDHYSVGTIDGLSSVYAFYQFVRLEGWMYPTQQSGTVPLKLYWHPQREDNFVTATSAGAADAIAAGYVFVRNEGYVLPAP
jgi:hypothetical protein